MKHNITQFIEKWSIPILFVVGFILIALQVQGLHFFIDDFPYALDTPNISTQFPTFFKNYIEYHGLYRPLSLLYYYGIYSLYWKSSVLAHLIPFVIHAVTGFLLYIVLKKQGMSYIFAGIAGLLYLLHPFAAEQYMWLSANPGTLASFIFMIQILIIYKGTSLKRVLFITALLSLAGTLIYESTFFFFIPLAYLIKNRCIPNPSFFSKKNGLIVGILLIPTLLYTLSKVIFPGEAARPLVNSIPRLIENTISLFQNLIKVHVSPEYLKEFWMHSVIQAQDILNNSLIFFTMFILFVLLIFFFIQIARSKSNKIETNPPIIFWILVLISSLIPLVANREFYFGFRSLFLPSITAIVLLLWLFQIALFARIQKVILFILLFLTCIFIFVTSAMAVNYRKTYEKDLHLVTQIATILKKNKFTKPNTVDIYLKSEVPFDSHEKFVHADYLINCFYYEWSALSCTKMKTDVIRNLMVEHYNGVKKLPFGIDEETIFKGRPLITLTYKRNGTVTVEYILP